MPPEQTAASPDLILSIPAALTPFRHRLTVTRLPIGDAASSSPINCPNNLQRTPCTRSTMPVAHQVRRSSSDLLRIDRAPTAEIHPNNSYNPSPAKRPSYTPFPPRQLIALSRGGITQ